MAGGEGVAWWLPVLTGLLGLTPTLVAAIRNRRVEARESAEDEQSAFVERPILRARIMQQDDLIAELRLEIRARDEQLRRLPTYLVERELASLNGFAKFFDMFEECIAAFTSDDSGTCMYINAALRNGLGGRPNSDFIGLAWANLVHPDDMKRTRAAEASAWANDIMNFKNRWLHTDGKYRWLNWNCRRYTGEGFTLCKIDVLEG